MLMLRPLTQTVRASARPLARPVLAQSASKLLFAPYRKVQTQSTTPDEALEILNRQRSNRPVSPHLQIYKMESNMISSSFHRITGVALGGAMYVFLCGYVGLPVFGVEFSSDNLMAAFGALPLIAKLPLKFVASLPFTFHFFNGIRHLVWDTASQLTLKGLSRTTKIVTGLTFLSSAILAFI